MKEEEPDAYDEDFDADFDAPEQEEVKPAAEQEEEKVADQEEGEFDENHVMF